MKQQKPKILYGINCTGQGHISRARTLIPCLKKYANVEILLSGKKQKIELPFQIHHHYRGISFVYEKGKVNWKKTLLKNNFFKLILNIFDCPVSDYDFVITDFEPITAMACFLKKKHCIHVSHQISFLSPKVPIHPKPSFLNKVSHLLMSFHSGKSKIGFHYKQYDSFIFPPLEKIAPQALDKKNSESQKEYYCVYLPAFSKQEILKHLHSFSEISFHFFHHHHRQVTFEKNVYCYPLSKNQFLDHLSSCTGYITHAGFESTAEALSLGIPLLSIPIQNQYEQYCNAAALKEMGVTILSNFNPQQIKSWLDSSKQKVKLETSSIESIVQHMLHLGTSTT